MSHADEDDEAAAALAGLSLTPRSPLTVALSTLLTGAQDIQRSFNSVRQSFDFADTDAASLRTELCDRDQVREALHDSLVRRGEVFTRYKSVLAGKRKAMDAGEGSGEGERDGKEEEEDASKEALRLWGEVEAVLGVVLEECRVLRVFSEEEMEGLKAVCEPGFDWGVGDAGWWIQGTGLEDGGLRGGGTCCDGLRQS